MIHWYTRMILYNFFPNCCHGNEKSEKLIEFCPPPSLNPIGTMPHAQMKTYHDINWIIWHTIWIWSIIIVIQEMFVKASEPRRTFYTKSQRNYISWDWDVNQFQNNTALKSMNTWWHATKIMHMCVNNVSAILLTYKSQELCFYKTL